MCVIISPSNEKCCTKSCTFSVYTYMHTLTKYQQKLHLCITQQCTPNLHIQQTSQDYHANVFCCLNCCMNKPIGMNNKREYGTHPKFWTVESIHLCKNWKIRCQSIMDEDGGFDCEFVKNPSSDIQSECPVCLQIIREPYQVTCCGYAFCQVCTEQLKRAKEPCPCCKRTDFDIFADMRLKRSLYNLSVYCSHRKLGCLWEGQLKKLDSHINPKPKQHQQLEGCQFTQIHCFYCSELFQRTNIKAHQDELCHMRPFSCEHCKNFDSYYQDVTVKHWLVCGDYPVLCPNKCGETLLRKTLTNHTAKDCPLTIVDCEFAYAGCEVKLPRKEMPKHLNTLESMATHLSQQAIRQKQLKQQNMELAKQISKLTQDLQKLQVSTPLCPVELIMYNFDKHMKAQDIWHSLPFYTHPKGYKMRVHITAYGTDRGKGTHMSVGVALMRGEYDKKLKWPFRGIVTIKVLSQEDDDHYTRIFDVPPPALASRALDTELANDGWGYYKFFPHTQLLRSKYTKYDCIKIICSHRSS